MSAPQNLSLTDAVTVELCILARAAGYPWSDTVDLGAASQWAAQRLTLNPDAVTVDGAPACTATLRLDDAREWSAGGPNAGAAMRTLAVIVRRAVLDGAEVERARACIVGTLASYDCGALAQLAVTRGLLAAADVRDAIVRDLAAKHPRNGWLVDLVKMQLEDLAAGRADRILASETAWIATQCEVCARAGFVAVDPTAKCERDTDEDSAAAGGASC